MFRSLLVLLLIAGLLMCPLRCTAGAGRIAPGGGPVRLDADAVATGCSCCRTRALEPAESPLDRSANDEACANCICHGAVVSQDGDVAQTGFMDALPATPRLASEGSAKLLAGTVAPCRFDAHGYPSTGRAARIARQSLQI